MLARSIVASVLVGRPTETADVRGSLLSVLRAIQHRLGHLPAEVFVEIEAQLGIPRHVAYSVASFYDEFRFDRPAAHTIRVCDGASCELAGCGELFTALSAELGIEPRGVTADGCFRLEAANCLGQCERCPAVRIDDWVFGHLAASELPGLLRQVRSGSAEALAALAARAAQDEEIVAPKPGEQRRLLDGATPGKSVTAEWDMTARANSLRNLMGRCSPGELLRVVMDSGLRGRGGAGFPAARKWQMAASYPAPRVLVCNADESEPGTFKDRLLLRHRPWLVLEGMLLAAYTIGADRGVLYLRGDYAYLQPQLNDCLEAMAKAGLLGEGPAGSTFSCHIDLHLGAGAYVCGEESALLESLEGRRGAPRLRPPYPVEAGWNGRPTVVTNVETLAYVPLIAARGAAWFRELGTVESAGTKLFSLSGDVQQPGVYELPLGTTLGALIDGPGGGVRGELGFVLLGGAAGRVLGKECLETPLDFEHQLGNGAVTVFHSGRRPIEIAANLLRFFTRETCGGCLPCRAGVPEAFAMFASAGPQGLTAQQRASFDMLNDCLEATARCGLGKTALRAARDLLELT
jgi:NADH:ubiquinone oxidoreductase subunit F (NADH-binding)/NADH:ubiquinone oxidoreductase subunit E